MSSCDEGVHFDVIYVCFVFTMIVFSCSCYCYHDVSLLLHNLGYSHCFEYNIIKIEYANIVYSKTGA